MNDTPNTVDVLLTGNTLPGADIDQAAAALAKMTGIAPEQARAIITGSKSRLLNRGLSPEEGLAVTARLATMGIEAVMRPGAPEKPATRDRSQSPPSETRPVHPHPPRLQRRNCPQPASTASAWSSC